MFSSHFHIYKNTNKSTQRQKLEIYQPSNYNSSLMQILGIFIPKSIISAYISIHLKHNRYIRLRSCNFGSMTLLMFVNYSILRSTFWKKAHFWYKVRTYISQPQWSVQAKFIESELMKANTTTIIWKQLKIIRFSFPGKLLWLLIMMMMIQFNNDIYHLQHCCKVK